MEKDTEVMTLTSKKVNRYTKQEVSQHNSRDDNWIIIEKLVYDVTEWSKDHPGGARIISHFSGQDATEAWRAMHTDMTRVTSLMSLYCIGIVSDKEESELIKDFRNLRQFVKKNGYMESSYLFYISLFLHCLFLDFGSLYILYLWPNSFYSFILSAILLATSQVQLGWLQHDFGHNSVMSSVFLNKLCHYVTIGTLKGVSSHWWNFRHFQHHVIPNRLKGDPDISFVPLFLVGTVEPLLVAEQHLSSGIKIKWPYQHQHFLFVLIAVPFLIPVYFHLEVLYFVFKRHDYLDMVSMIIFYARIFYTFTPLIGISNFFIFYYLMRLIESMWFMFVTQSNHLSNPIDDYKDSREWPVLQTRSTCNISAGYFNDWFTGHLNYQIEHHFFPLMPRCNYRKVSSLTRQFCVKHKLMYSVKPMSVAFQDCIKSLKESGNIWYKAYHHKNI